MRVVLVTGRRHPSARQVAAELAAGLPLVVHNGALVVEDGEIVRCRPLAREVARARDPRGPGARPRADRPLRDPRRGMADRGGERASRGPASATTWSGGADGLRRVADLLEALPREEPIQVMFGGAVAGDGGPVRGALGDARERGAARAHGLSRDRLRARGRARSERRQGGGARLPAASAGASRPARRSRSATTGTTARCWSRRAAAC